MEPHDIWFLTYTLLLATATLVTTSVTLRGHWNQWRQQWLHDEPHYHIFFLLATPSVTRLLYPLLGLVWWFAETPASQKHVLYVQYGCDVLDWFALYHYCRLLWYYFYRQATLNLRSDYPFHYHEKCHVDEHYVADRLARMFRQQLQKKGLLSLSFVLTGGFSRAMFLLLMWRILSFFAAIGVLEMSFSLSKKDKTTVGTLIWTHRLVDLFLLTVIMGALATQLNVVQEHVHRFLPGKKLVLLGTSLFSLGLSSFLLPLVGQKSVKQDAVFHYNVVSLTLCVTALCNHCLYPATEMRQCVTDFDMQYETNSPEPCVVTSRVSNAPMLVEVSELGHEMSSDTDESLMVRFSSSSDEEQNVAK